MLPVELRHASVSLLCASLLASGCGDSKTVAPPRAWMHESEFADAKVAAARGTVVILELEPGTSSQRNTVRYSLEKSGTYQFCLDEEDALLRSALLEDANGQGIVLLDRALRCRSLHLSAGTYTLHVHHDGTAVGTGAHAFLQPVQAAPAAVTAMRTAGAPLASAGPRLSSPLTGDKWIGDWWPMHADLFSTSGSHRRLFMLQSTNDAEGAYPHVKYRFPALSGSSFQCGPPGQQPWRCCFLLGDKLPGDQYTQPYELLLGENAECDGPSLLRYELQDRDDGFACSLYDGANARYVIWELMDVWPYGVPNFPSGRPLAVVKGDYAWDPTSHSIEYLAIELPAGQVNLDELTPGSAVLYDGANCSGTATVVTSGGRYRFDPTNWNLVWTRPPVSRVSSVRVAHDSRVSIAYGPFLDGPPSVCRNLTPAVLPERDHTVNVDVENVLQTLISSKQCKNCDLVGVNFSGMPLDGYDLSGSYLGSTDLSSASLKGANLANAVLSGAKLDHANLEGANLCGAFLNGSGGTPAASLVGAYLKNANLASANLSGAVMTNVNFYSGGTGSSCAPTACDGTTPWPGTCATATGATMTGTQMTDAYLPGVDFSGVLAQGVNFSSSILVGANFQRATLGVDPASSAQANFSNALLQGADFSSANATGTTFDSAYVDMTGPGEILSFSIKGPHEDFAGFWITPAAPICVTYGYSAKTIAPLVDASTSCPSGHRYGEVYCPDHSVVYLWKCTGTGKPPVTEDCWSGTPRVPIEQSLMVAQFDKCDPFTKDVTW